jgi:hypothetical protein
MEKVKVALSGGAAMTTDTDAKGNYRFTGLSNGNYIITPTASRTLFEPESRNVTIKNRDLVGVNFAVRPVAKGDINYDGVIDLRDLILTLQVMSELQPSEPIYKDADVNGNRTIGLEEAIFILQEVSGPR